ncbi:feruloyl CoA ortho-hydroxylase 1-like [Gossypium australe]|uniref:Feruloyl CoA ortho-hydroxylase 1-like n=1 Tax=Gossypium australe TaxID=47621 RepID=A0A5B6VFF1_9ROSI|nr:feruloyl CoA ortho-hydroxylase 1-like [Gossypium australe]
MAPSFDNETSLFNFVVRDGNGVKGIVDLGISKVPQAYIQPPAEQINKRNASKFVNHGVPKELLDSLKQTAHNFFGLPPEKKAVYRKEVSPSPLVKYGTSFAPEKEKALEWKDYISMAYTNDDEALQQWPVECRTPFRYGYSYNLITRRNWRLVVKVPQDVNMEKKGEWVAIPPIPGALVINIGDMLQIWSNGRYKSAERRVRTTSTKSRVSIPIFTSPLPTQKIAPLPQVVEKDGAARYREFLFSDYMNNFFGNAHDGKKSLEFAKTTSA